MTIMLLILTALLCLDWWRRSRLARVCAVVVSLVVLFFSGPVPGRAMRTVVGLSRAERVTEIRNWGLLSDYHSGVMTMERAMHDDIDIGRRERQLSVSVLVWLAVSPVLRRGGMRTTQRPAGVPAA